MYKYINDIINIPEKFREIVLAVSVSERFMSVLKLNFKKK